MGKSLVSCFFLTHGVVVCPVCFFLFSSRSFGCFLLFLNEILVHSKPLVLLCFIVVFLRLYYMVKGIVYVVADLRKHYTLPNSGMFSLIHHLQQ